MVVNILHLYTTCLTVDLQSQNVLFTFFHIDRFGQLFSAGLILFHSTVQTLCWQDQTLIVEFPFFYLRQGLPDSHLIVIQFLETPHSDFNLQ